MAESRWLQHALHVGGFEFRRSVRAIWRDRARAFLMAAGLFFPSLMLAGFIYLFSGVIQDAGTVALPPIARGTIALLWLFGVFIATQRVVSARPRIDAEPLMLTTVSARTVVGGLLVAETLRVLAYLALPVLVLTGGVVYLFGSLVSIFLIPLAAILLGLTAVLVGMVLGYAVALLIATSSFVANHKAVLGGIATLGAMGGYLLLTLPQFGGVGQEALAVLPVGWFVDIAAIGSPVQGSMTRAGVAVIGSLLVVIGGIALVEREASRLWFIDPVSSETETATEHDHVTPNQEGIRTKLADAIAPLGIPQSVSRPTRSVAHWTLLRTRRDPSRLNLLLLPVVMVGSGLISSGMQAEFPLVVFAPTAAVMLPWMAGAAFAMNPLGEEGAVLPVTLISVPGQDYVRGLMLPGLLFGLPVAVLVTTIAVLVGPFEPSVAIGLVGVSLLSTLVAVTTAPAVGLWFPRFSAISIGQSREVIPPRLMTTAFHFLGVTIPGAILAILILEPQLARTLIAGITGFLPAALLQLATGGNGGVLSVVGTWFHDIGTAIQSLGVETFRFTTGATLVLGALIVVIVSYMMAVRRFDKYSPTT